MPLIELLFKLRPNEVQGDQWGWHCGKKTVSAGNVNVFATLQYEDFPFPDQHLFWLHTLVVRAIPGATQRVQELFVQILDSNANNLAEICGAVNPLNDAAADERLRLTWSGLMLLGPTQQLQAQGVFSGTTSNQITLSYGGQVSPRGNGILY